MPPPKVLHLKEPFSNSNPLTLTLPSKPIQNLDFTGDGRGFSALSLVDGEQQYHLWQLSDSAKITKFIIPPESQPISTSLSGKLVAILTSPQTIKIYNAITGHCLSELIKIPGYTVKSLEFDSDDSLAAVVQITSSENQTSYIQSISPENRSKYTIKCVGLKNENNILNIDGTGEIEHLKIAPGGNFLIFVRKALNEPTSIEVIPLVSGLKRRTIKINGNVDNIAISPDGLHVSAKILNPMDSYRTECQIHIYDLFNGREKGNVSNLPSLVTNWAYSHDGRRLALLTQSSSLHLLSVNNGKPAAEPLQLPYKTYGISFSPSDRHVRVKAPNELIEFTIQVSPVAPRRILPPASVSAPVITSVIADPESRFLTFLSVGHNGGAISIHPLVKAAHETEKLILRIEKKPICGAFSPDGQFFVVGLGNPDEEKGVAYIYRIPQSAPFNTENWKKIKSLSLPMPVAKVSFSKDSNWLLLAGTPSMKVSKTLALYNCREKKLELSYISHDGPIYDACFSRDSSRIITAGSDKFIRIWDITTKKQVKKIQCSEFPHSVVCLPNDNIAYLGRFGNYNGKVEVFSKDGKSLWEKNFGFGIEHFAVNHSGKWLALGSLGKKACVFNIKTGQQLTEWMRQSWPISSIGFIHSGSRDVLAVGGHEPHIPFTEKDNAGGVELWDITTFRRIGDTIEHSDGVKGIMQMSDGRICSWDSDSAIVSTSPLSYSAQVEDPKELINILGRLGGMTLNRQGVSMPYQPIEEAKSASSGPDQTILQWLRTPLEIRSIAPGTQIMIMDRLKSLSKRYFEEYQLVLEIAPDYLPVLSDYWFPAANEVARIDYMQAVVNKSAFEKNRLRIKWDLMKPHEKMQTILDNRKASRIADFWTQQACIKGPDSPEAWYNRSVFFRHKGSFNKSIAAITKAAELDPNNLEIQYQYLHYLFQKDGPEYALKRLKTLCKKVSEQDTSDVGMIGSLGFFRLYLSALVDGSSKNLSDNLGWLERTVKNRIENGNVGFESILYIQETTLKLSGFLICFPHGAKIARNFTLNLEKFLKEKYPLDIIGSFYQSSLLSNASLLSLLVGDNQQAIALSNRAVSEFPDNPFFMINQAHSLDIAGQWETARKIYESILDLDRHYNGKLSLELYKDACLLKKHEIQPKSLLEIREQLIKRLKKEFEQGYVIRSITPGSQAEKMGLHVGDQLFRYNGEPILDYESFGWERIASAYSKKDDPDSITVIRDGKPFKLDIQHGLLGITFDKVATGLSRDTL